MTPSVRTMLALRTIRILAVKMHFLLCGPNAKACFQIDTSIASFDPLTLQYPIPSRRGRRHTSSESEVCLRIHFGSKPRNAAKDETKGFGPASHRAFDWQQRCRLGRVAGCPALRTSPVAARCRQRSEEHT